MSGHTKGPWWNDGIVIKNDGAIVAQALKESDARRIVACWNACEGVSTAGVEAIAALGGIQHKMPVAAELVRQRDQLLVALKGLLDTLAMPSDTTHPAIRAARAAVAACDAEPAEDHA